MHDTQVLIVGAGPVGLVLAIELGQQGVSSIVVDEIQERLLAPLSEGERRQFITLMRRVATGN